MYAELERKICTKCGVAKDKKEFGAIVRRGKTHSHCKSCKKIARQKRRVDFPEQTKANDFRSDLKRHYGITPEVYEEMIKGQNFCCACCGSHMSNFKRRLHVDHDHKTGLVRSLLCTECNPGIGYFDHSIERLEMAIRYLEKFKK